MSEPKPPYDQRLARICVRPFAGTFLHPNVVTALSLLLGAASGLVFGFSEPSMQHLAALLFILAVFVDHMDGELARMSGKTSQLGYFLDYIVGCTNYTILFCSLGVAMFRWTGSDEALLVGLAAGLANPIIVGLRLSMERRFGSNAVEHPRSGGFEIEDFIYLIGPLTWFGGLSYFFWLYALGTIGYLIWTLWEFARWAWRE